MSVVLIALKIPNIVLYSFDVELPLECDDEYWENPDPELAFKQPPGVPSTVSFFVHIIKLIQIHSSSRKAFVGLRIILEVALSPTSLTLLVFCQAL